MKSLIKILGVCFLLGISLSGSSKNLKGSSVSESDKQTIELIINGERYPIQNVNPNAQVEVYSIIGSKVTSFQIKSGVSDSAVSLSKGYYIIKIDDSTRKIAVK